MNSEDFKQVKSKFKSAGPRKIKYERKNEAYLETNKLSFKELLFERNNLKKHEHSPKVDLWEEKKENNSYYIIKMEIPGINKDKINIEIKDKQVVLVTTFKNDDKLNLDLDIVYSECKYGKITRRIKLQNLVYEDFRFKYEDGILKIEIKQIQVEINVKLDDRLDDSKTTILIDKKSDTKIIDFKDLSLLTGDWADEPYI